MAPFTPFLSEHIYQELKNIGSNNSLKESVHLDSYPNAIEEKINSTLEDAVDRMQQIILLGRQKRNQEQIKVKTPLSTLTIIHKDQTLLDEISKLENYIKSELNIKNINYSTNESSFIKIYARPNFRVLGKRLGKTFKQYKSLIESMNSEQISILETDGSITIENENFATTDIELFREAKDGGGALSNRFISINLDCNLTDELIMEGHAREVVNRIQKSRKDSGFNVADRIEVQFSTGDLLTKVINTHIDHIGKETLSTLNSVDLTNDNNSITTHDIDGEELLLLLKKKS
jgi:isoleucyl-tRNA synthetase